MRLVLLEEGEMGGHQPLAYLTMHRIIRKQDHIEHPGISLGRGSSGKLRSLWLQKNEYSCRHDL
jgi:hypothetical protein